MNLSKNQSQKSIPWFSFSIAAIFLISAGLRFWELGRFNALVFDEVYYAKFANNYLTETPFFNAHPPLSQYLIALSIWIGSRLPFGQEFTNNLTGSHLAPWTYRWLNALTGSLIPLVVGAIAYQLARRRSYALIAALLIAADGLFLVESRYALNNIYLVIFGLWGHLCLLISLKFQKLKRWFWLILAGINFGASAAIKWNGLGFLLGVYLVFIFAVVIQFLSGDRQPEIESQAMKTVRHSRKVADATSPLSKLTRLNLGLLALTLAILPVIIYSLIWIPHLQLNPKPNFWEMQQQILGYHQRIGDGREVHPYCAKWYTWILTIRPIVYFYKNTATLKEADASLPPIAAGSRAIFDVHAMPNPVLSWLSGLAIFLVLLILIHRFWIWIHDKFLKQRGDVASATLRERQLQLAVFPATPEMWLFLYLAINWMANLLPWVKVSRCTFLYHYTSSYVFAVLALAWWIERWLRSKKNRLRAMGITAIFLVLLAFVFWMPIYLGLPLSPAGWKIRMWFSSWI